MLIFFLMVLEFELRASSLLGKFSTTWPTSPDYLFIYLFGYFSDRVSTYLPVASLRLWSSYLCLLCSWSAGMCHHSQPWMNYFSSSNVFFLNLSDCFKHTHFGHWYYLHYIDRKTEGPRESHKDTNQSMPVLNQELHCLVLWPFSPGKIFCLSFKMLCILFFMRTSMWSFILK
jgi:hypothetical protein